MIKIADFNSVLQIAFGLNALFYAFELVPQTESRIRELAEKHHKLMKEKAEVTKNREVFPVGFIVSLTYPPEKRFFSRLTLLISIVILGLMIYDGFYSDAQLPAFWMWSLLLPALIAPWIAVRLHSRTIKLIESVNSDLETQIREARQAIRSSTAP